MHRMLLFSLLLLLGGCCLLAAAERHCPEGENWYHFNGNCYRWSGEETEGWFGAEKQCQQLGGHLVTIASKSENNFLHAMAQCSQYFWIGMVKTGVREKAFSWWDDSPSNYTEMLSIRNNEYYDCVYFDTSYNSKWYNGYCQNYYRYVCVTSPMSAERRSAHDGAANRAVVQKSGSLESAADVEASTLGVSSQDSKLEKQVNKDCPDGWLKLEHNCYFVSSERANYFNAQISCERMHATVSTVANEREQTLITMALGCNTQAWIGLEKVRPCISDPIQDFCWTWMDGTPLTYAAWSLGFPSTSKEVECATSGGRWRTTNCYNEFPYICKKK